MAPPRAAEVVVVALSGRPPALDAAALAQPGANVLRLRGAELQTGEGLGLLPDCVVEPHCSERGGCPRLLAAMERTGCTRGLGLDAAVCAFGPGAEFAPCRRPGRAGPLRPEPLRHRPARCGTDRLMEVSRYISRTKATVRDTAKVFGVSKSTVHKDVTERLPKMNRDLAARVKKVLDTNKAERHLRGGEATRRKYLDDGQPAEQEELPALK